MRTTISVLGWIAVLMGIIHILFVFPINEFRLGHMWFIGSGIAILFAGIINLLGQTSQKNKWYSTPEQALDSFSAASCGVLNPVKNKTSFILVLFANFIMCFLFIVGTMVLHEPQVYFGIVLFAALAVLTVLMKRSSTSL